MLSHNLPFSSWPCLPLRAGKVRRSRPGRKATLSDASGTCEQGAMKFLHERLPCADGGARPAPPKPPTPIKRSNEGIITECKDGPVVRGGDRTP